MNKRYPIGTFDSTKIYDDAVLEEWIDEIRSLPLRLKAELYGLEDDILDTPYREGGWTVRQIVHHLGDSHLNALTRFKLALTEDNPTIKPYDEKRWAQLGDYETVSIKDGLDFVKIIHRKWVAVLETMKPEDFKRTLIHPEGRDDYPNDLFRITGMYAWHGNHHLAHIQLVTQNK